MHTKRNNIVVTKDVFRPRKSYECVCGWGSVPDPAGGAYSAPPDAIARFGRGADGVGRKGERGENGREEIGQRDGRSRTDRKGREGSGRKRKGSRFHTSIFCSTSSPDHNVLYQRCYNIVINVLPQQKPQLALRCCCRWTASVLAQKHSSVSADGVLGQEDLHAASCPRPADIQYRLLTLHGRCT